MSKGNVDKFLGLMQNDEGLARKMAACLYKLETNDGKAEGSGDFITREIVPLAKEYGFEFTAQDFLDYTEEAKAKVGLTAEDLAEVSGGKGGVRAALMGTLALLGVAAAPAAMKMVSGGEVSPFSMVASAAEVDDQKLKYLRHGLTVLKEDISKYGSDDDKCYEYAKDIDSLLTQIDDFYLPNSVVSLDSLLTNVNTLATNITRDITSRWWKLKFKLDNLEQLVSERKNFLDENKYKTQITELRMRMQTLSSSDLGLVESAFRDISFDVEEFSADVVIKNSNQAKDRLATDISEKITSLKEKNTTTTNDAIGDLEKLKSRLETEVKDLTAENVLDKEKIVKEVQNEFGEISKKIDTAINLNFDFANEKEGFQDKLDGLENFVVNVQKRTDAASVQEAIKRLRACIDSFGDVTYENANEKATELENIKKEIESLMDVAYGFEENLFTHVKKPKKNIGEMLTFYKNEAKKAKDQAAVDEIEKLEQELAAISEQPTDALELSRVATRIGNIKVSIPQIKAMLNKATTLKKIAEKVYANFAKNFDEIIKDIEAADRVDKINLAEERLQNAEITLRGVMQAKINKAKGLYHVATKLGVRNLEVATLRLIQDASGVDSLEEGSIDKFKPLSAGLNKIGQDIKNYLGKQIDNLAKQATKLQDMATGVDDTLAGNFNKFIERLNGLKLTDDLQKITTGFNQVKDLVNERAKELLPKAAIFFNEVAKSVAPKLSRAFEGIANITANPETDDDLTTGLDLLKERKEELREIVSTQIDDLVDQANELKGQADGVDGDLKKRFEETANSLKKEKENLLKNLAHAAKIVSDVSESLAERQGDLVPKLALKKQIATLKEQTTKLKDMATGVYDLAARLFGGSLDELASINLGNNLEQITNEFDTAKTGVNRCIYGQLLDLVKVLEIDALLENEVMGTEMQDELKAIKAGLPKADKANADTVVKAFDAVKAVKTKMANKLLEWHKVLSKYHNKNYHKEGKKDVVEINLNVLAERANQMLNGADGIKLDAETLNDATKLALEIAGNLNTDIADVIDTVEGYEGFRTTGFRLLGGIRIGDYTAAWQANTLVTFLRNNFDIVDDLNFVDKKTRAKLAKDIKHIFDQIKIDQKTGKYYLPGFYNQIGAVNHDDLKLICEAYDVVAEDFGKRLDYMSFKDAAGTPFQDRAAILAEAMSQIQRLDLLDVSPESRDALKKDIMEIGAKIKSTPGWIYGQTLSLDGVDQKETKNMQSGLAKILEFYNSIQAQMKAHK